MSWRNPACTLCPHYADADTVCMAGAGPQPAKVMIVGEAPGQQEDYQGRPFVGPSGEYLDRMLALAGINRSDCYVTNVVKCHPIDNETPTRGEVKICVTAYLGEELLTVQPKYILLLGNAALQGVAGKSGITKHRGVVWEARGSRIFATFHPAAVLRNPRYRALVETDFQRFGRLVRGERSPTPETKVQIIRTKAHLKWLVDKILEAKELSYDVETYCDHPTGTNFQEYRGDHSLIVSVSFTWQEGQAAVVPLSHAETPWADVPRVIRILAAAIRQSGARNIAHNGLYDAKWMSAKGMPIPQHADTMLMSHMLDENRPKGLKPLSQILLGADSYDVGDELHDAFHMPIKRLCLYNGKDTDYTLRIYHAQRKELLTEPRTARVYQKLMMPASNALVTIQANGIQLDMERWGERFDKASANVEKVRRFMLQFVDPQERETINFNSPMQVGRWLFEYLELPVIERTAKGATSSKESVLLQLARHHKAAAALLKYRKWSKYLSTYLLPWRDFRDGRNRIHPNYKLFGTVTGRLSCVDPNLQQVPRDSFIRGVLGARPGWSLVVADYSQVELRIAAMMADEPTMLGQFARGEDIHMLRAMRMTGKPASEVTKEQRKHAKPVSFGFLYGMGAPKFIEYARDSYEVIFNEDEAEAVRRGFFFDYPELLTWHDRQRRLARKYGKVTSPIGRTRHLPDIASKDRGVQGEAERQAINSPVQSLASDLMLIAMVELQKNLDRNQAIIVGTVHDSILFEVRDEWTTFVASEIKATMEDMSLVKRKFGTEITVPIVADIEVSKHWSDAA